MQRLLDVRPLRWVGRVSYGAYLFHWPLFSWLSADRLGVDGFALFAVQTTITLSLAAVSARLIEEPIRRRRLLPACRPPPSPGSSPPPSSRPSGSRPPPSTAGPRASRSPAANGSRPRPAGPTPSRPPPPPRPTERGATTTAPAPEVRRLLLVGDSITQQLAPYVAQALPAVDVRWIGDAGIGPLTDQGRIGDELETAVADLDPDVVVLHFAGSYLDRQPDADPYVLANGSAVEDDSDLMVSAWESQSRRLAETARSRGATVLWGLIPPIDDRNWFGYLADTVDPLNGIYRRLPDVTVLDWHRLAAGPDGGFVRDLPDASGERHGARAEDGLHFTAFGNALLAASVSAALADWPGRVPPAGPAP